MKKYSDETIEFEYPPEFSVEKYNGGYGIRKGKHGLVIDIGLIARFNLSVGRTADDLLGKYDVPDCRRTVIGEVQYKDKKAFVQYFISYHGDRFIGKAAQLLFKEGVTSPLFVRIQSGDNFNIEDFRPLLESIEVKDVSAFTFEESKARKSRKKKSLKVELPAEIEHLEAVICELSSFDPDELGDDNQEAMDLIEQATDTVIGNMSKEKAIKTIKNHLDIIEQLREEKKLPLPPLAFIQGVLIGMLAFKFNDYSKVEGS